VRLAYATGSEPDGVLLVRCGNRREAVCRSCGAERKGDAYQLVKAGLVGGKGVPASVGSHPKLFVTLTAPSFGAVHTRVAKGKNVDVCHPRHGHCPHGRPLGCFKRHVPGQDCLGQAICPECFDYRALVVWNARAPELWRRTRMEFDRAVARVVGMSRSKCGELVRVQFIKVGEYQGRGAVHFHALIRLDARPPESDPDAVAPPPALFTLDVLEQAVDQAIRTTTVPCPPATRISEVGWGTAQIDRLRGRGPGELTHEAVASYISKYATKGTEGFGARLERRLSAVDIERLDASPHVQRIVRACWDLGGQPELEELRLREWAHCLGFGGHWLTKSGRYSTTFKACRRERRVVARQRRFEGGVPLDAFGRREDEDQVVVLAEWTYKGSGYQTQAERWLALSAAARARERREAAREAVREAANE
ncbi:MAG TPA: replication initiator, partial [Actinomycetota bacterium]